MNGLTAKKIAKTMKRKQKEVKRGLSTSTEVTDHFCGYLSALCDMDCITKNEQTMFMTEFVGSLS